MNKTITVSLTVIVAAAIGLWFVFQPVAYVPATDVLTFERVVDNDEGRRLNPADLVSNEGVHLVDVFDLGTKRFTPERMSRYGADRTNPKGGGVGLTVNFIRKDGGQTETKTFTLAGWTAFERSEDRLSTRPQRRTEVMVAEPRLAQAIEAFVAPVHLSYTFGVVVDTTEGVDNALAQRVREVIKDTRAVERSKAGHSVVVNMYHITESSYQGARRHVDLDGNFEEAENWLLTPAKEEVKSSVLRGLAAILTEMSKAGENPVLHIFTDGLENTDALSVYKTPILLDDEEGWLKLDEAANLAGLTLKGMEVHLNRLPPKSPRHEQRMEKGLAYLADRLTKAGATVTIEPL